MTHHLVLATGGFALTVWLALIAFAARAMWQTRAESSLVEWRRSSRFLHVRSGQGDMSLRIQLILATALALASAGFTLWQLILGVFA